ncbi:hypothetical protein, partial [Shewanella sp. TC10]|uniref:hypothetical protein n=1 Tax=Shewanella sp. TC10 TaxID=1419739 RepID=UPI001E384647
IYFIVLSSLSFMVSATSEFEGVELLADVNNDGITDWVVYGSEYDSLKFDIFSGVDGTFITQYYFPENFTERTYHWVKDRTGDGVRDVGLFGFNVDNEKYQFVLLNSAIGNIVNTWTWNPSLYSPEFIEIEDLTLDGIGEFAIVGSHKANGTTQLQVKDGKYKNKVNTFKWSDNWTNPSVITMTDFTGDTIPEVALFGLHKRRNNGQLFIYDGNNPSGKLTTYNWVKNWENIELLQLQDIDGDGTKDWGQFGQRIDDGRYQLVIKKGSTKVGTIRTLTWNSTILKAKPFIVNDMTNDGINDIAIVGYDIGSARYKALINDGRLPNRRVKNITWPTTWGLGSQVINIHDIDNDGVDEIALLGIDTISEEIKLSIKSVVTGKQLQLYTWDHQWYNVHLDIYDANGDGVLDFALTGEQYISKNSRVSVIDGYTHNVLFDRILEPERVTLESFLLAKNSNDFRFYTSFNDEVRSQEPEGHLLFDGEFLTKQNMVFPYSVENSILKIHHENGEIEDKNFLYVSNQFGISVSDDELGLYTKKLLNGNITKMWTEEDILNKSFHFIEDNAEEGSINIDPNSFSIGFLQNNQALVTDVDTYFVPWSINDEGQIVVSVSEHNGEDDFILSYFASDDVLNIVTEQNRNNKPMIMSEDYQTIFTLMNNWLLD